MFVDSDDSDVVNYINCVFYLILYLICEVSMSEVLDNYNEFEFILEYNIKFVRCKGIDFW